MIALRLLLLLALSAAAQALTADELIAKNLQARGGLEKLKAVQSLKLVGKLRYGGSTELAYQWLARRPGWLRTETSLQGMTAVSAFDGREGWEISPFGGRRDPERIPAQRAQGLAYEADLDGPLVDYQAKGYRVTYLGTEDVEGSQAHKLQVDLKDGDSQTYFLDPDCFLAIRVLTRRLVRGVESESATDLSDYELVQGVYLPWARDFGSPGGEHYGHLQLEKVEVNPDLPESLFHFPEGK